MLKVQKCGGRANNRAENSHQPFRRREAAMARFRDIKTLQKFSAIHASIHNHFNLERHLNSRDISKTNRTAALTEWRQLAVDALAGGAPFFERCIAARSAQNGSLPSSDTMDLAASATFLPVNTPLVRNVRRLRSVIAIPFAFNTSCICPKPRHGRKREPCCASVSLPHRRLPRSPCR